MSFFKNFKKEWNEWKKIDGSKFNAEGWKKIKHPFFWKLTVLCIVSFFLITILLPAIFSTYIKDVEQAKKYLSNTTWQFTHSWQFDSTKWMDEKIKFVFDKNTENCHSEYKPDPDMTKQDVDSKIEWVVFEEDTIDSIEKKYFVNNFGRKTKDAYFLISSDCFSINKQEISAVLLYTDGDLKVRYYSMQTFRLVEENLRKK